MEEVEITFELERGEGDDYEYLQLTIIGSVEGYVPANLSGHPDNWSPAEGGGAYVEGVFLDGEPWKGELTQKEESQAEKELYSQWEENQGLAAEAAAESRYEASREEVWFDSRADYLY